MISVNNCGYDSKHQTALDMRRPAGNDDYTLLLVKTNAFFEVGGVLLDTPPNTVMLYGRHSYVHYGCRAPHYNDDWIHFDLAEEDTDFLSDLRLPLNIPFTLGFMGQLTEYSRLIVSEKLSGHIYGGEIINSLMHGLLYSIAARCHTVSDSNSDNKYYRPMCLLRMEILNAPHKNWTVPSLSEKVHLSPSYFQHLYKSFFNTTCMQDMIAARIKNAQFYLCTTEMSVQALSVFCGYENELHFMRQFKSRTGMTPSQYRAQNRKDRPAVQR